MNTLWGWEEDKVTRKCLDCYETKPLEDFEFRQSTEGNLYRNQCKACRSTHRNELQKIKKEFGSLMPKEGSDYKCPLCGKNEEQKQNKGTRFVQQSRKLRVWVFDHKHGGPFRDIICSDCNVGIARFMEDPQAMRRGADYLEYHDGAVAHLGERIPCTDEVAGSIPVGSTIKDYGI